MASWWAELNIGDHSPGAKLNAIITAGADRVVRRILRRHRACGKPSIPVSSCCRGTLRRHGGEQAAGTLLDVMVAALKARGMH